MNQKAPQPLVDLKGIPPKHYARATEAQGNLRRFSEYCKKYKATTIAKAYHAHEVENLLSYIETIEPWIDAFREQLTRGENP